MEQTIIFSATICLLIFGIIGIIDGFYYHLWKFNLYKHKETRVEHITHTLRMFLFLAMIYLLFMNDFGGQLFLLGVGLAIFDMIILIIDLITEGNSRDKLGGLPHREYIVHVIANALHFSSVALILAAKPLSYWSFDAPLLVDRFYSGFTIFVAENLIPGVVILSLLHVLLMNKKIGNYFEQVKGKIIR